MAFKFEKLIVWQKAIDLSDKINELTKQFPKDELKYISSEHFQELYKNCEEILVMINALRSSLK